jgi:hypothetical protein
MEPIARPLREDPPGTLVPRQRAEQRAEGDLPGQVMGSVLYDCTTGNGGAFWEGSRVRLEYRALHSADDTLCPSSRSGLPSADIQA